MLINVVIVPHIVPTLTVTISPSDPIHGVVGLPLIINCTVRTVVGVETSSVMISWMGPGGGSVMDDSRIIFSQDTSSDNIYTIYSYLQFTYLMQGDEGTYTCYAMIMGSSESQSVELQSLTSKFPHKC